MSEYIPDYNDLYEAFAEEQAEKEKKFPKCDYCGERIVEEKFYNIEGTYICVNCIDDFKVDTDNYMED